MKQINCAYCGERFKGDDHVLTLKITEEIIHDGECFVNHVFDEYGDQVLTYLEYLESKVE